MTGRDHMQRIDASLKRLGGEYRDELAAQVRVEPRLIGGQWVNVKVCPPAYAWGADSLSERNCTSVTQAIGDGCNHLTAHRRAGG